MNEPVQVVLNPEALRAPRVVNRPNGNGTDFYEGRDSAFGAHRDQLVADLQGIVQFLDDPDYRKEFGGLGYVQVFMSSDAIAKSHRPQTRLFRAGSTPHVATEGIGQPIYAVTPTALRRVISDVMRAEMSVLTRTNSRSGEVAPYPSRNRCEVSAIEGLKLWTASDKRDFSAAEGAAWLAGSSTGGAYVLQTFAAPVADRNPELLPAEQSSLQRLRVEIAAAGSTSRPIGPREERTPLFGLRVGDIRRQLTASDGERGVDEALDVQEISFAPDDHQRVLDAVARNPIVRSISLPPILVRDSGAAVSIGSHVSGDLLSLDGSRDYPKVGVIDGGVAGPISSWVAERWGQVSDPDRDPAHGTFITGLLVAAGQLNSYLASQSHGCIVYDIDVLPADPGGTNTQFAAYYPNGIPDFLDEVESAVEHFRTTQNVRIFNFSMNIASPGDGSRYGLAARRLDEIAARLDVIFVISAGNMDISTQRQEWPGDSQLALAALISDRVGFLSEPGESLFNASVSALNPPGLPGQVPFALARYSRRGPGLRGAVKPDFAHIGGSGSPSPTLGSNLFSLDESGLLVANAGTSFAAPIVARRLADLDSLIEDDVTRETLLAMMIHHSEPPELMRTSALAPVARDLVGFGVPAFAEAMLDGPDAEITLVFESIIRPGEQATVDFAWPQSLVAGGKCRGRAKLTLVARPILNYDHGDERIRVNIDAKLMQQQRDGGYASQLKSTTPGVDLSHAPLSERDLMREAMKWQAVKVFDAKMPRGRGASSNWRFSVEYLTRKDESLPLDGVAFSAVLTIGDIDGLAPVFQEMRQALQLQGIRTSDIRTSIRARAQV